MGKRGPQPTPTPILKLRGSWRAGQRTGEPTPPPELPEAPTWLSEPARPHWQRFAERLAGLGIMAAIHAEGLGMLAEAMADFDRLNKKAATAPLLIMGSQGQKVMNPIFAARSEAWQRTLKSMVQFGMTPAAITSIKTIHPDESQAQGLAKFKLANRSA